MFSDSKIAVIGSGSWATALAKIMLHNVDRINWYFRNPENIEAFKSSTTTQIIYGGLNLKPNGLTFSATLMKPLKMPISLY